MIFHPSFDSIVAAIKKFVPNTPELVLVLGSGLSDLADKVEDAVSISYDEIPDFITTRVAGHRGYLVFGSLGGKSVLIFAGRAHLYEGAAMHEATLPAQVAHGLGARGIILTSSAGALNPNYRAGDLVIIEDQINLMGTNPLFEAFTGTDRRPFDPSKSPFLDMDGMYDIGFEEKLRSYADSIGVRLHRGIAAAVSGPIYETPAERRMIRGFGADLVSMSTIPEAIAAHYFGLRIAALDMVANEVRRSGEGLSHSHVLKAAETGAGNFAKIIIQLIGLFP